MTRTHAVLAATLVGVFLAVQSSTAFGHARLVRSDPKDKAVLAEPPSAVRLWFNELLDKGFHSVEVFPAAQRTQRQRQNLVSGPVTVDPDDRTCLHVSLAPLSPGEYVVEYRVLSRDGHTAPGRISFRVTGSP